MKYTTKTYTSNHIGLLCTKGLTLQHFVRCNFICTNRPHVFHVEKTWKRPFPRHFNVEKTLCVCRFGYSKQFCLHSGEIINNYWASRLDNIQAQPFTFVTQNRCFEKFWKIHWKMHVLESSFNEIGNLDEPVILFKEDSSASVLLCILKKCSKQLL